MKVYSGSLDIEIVFKEFGRKGSVYTAIVSESNVGDLGAFDVGMTQQEERNGMARGDLYKKIAEIVLDTNRGFGFAERQVRVDGPHFYVTDKKPPAGRYGRR
jgi:hypothetical protein